MHCANRKSMQRACFILNRTAACEYNERLGERIGVSHPRLLDLIKEVDSLTKNKFIEILCPISFMLFGIFIRVSMLGMSERNSTLPNMVAYIIIVVSIIQLILDLRTEKHKERFKSVNFLKLLECTVAMFLYVFLLRKIGFIIDTFFLTAFTMYALDYKNYKMLVVASVIITAVVFVAFTYLLKVPLPTLWL